MGNFGVQCNHFFSYYDYALFTACFVSNIMRGILDRYLTIQIDRIAYIYSQCHMIFSK